MKRDKCSKKDPLMMESVSKMWYCKSLIEDSGGFISGKTIKYNGTVEYVLTACNYLVKVYNYTMTDMQR